MKRIKEYYITIILIIMVIVVNLAAFASYFSNIQTNLDEQTASHVDDIMDEAMECINIKLEEQINSLKTMALFVATFDNYVNEREILLTALENQKKMSGYSTLEIAGIDGIGVETGDSYAEQDFFQSALNGEYVMQEITDGDSITGVYFAAPVKNTDTDQVESVLVAKMDSDVFSDTTELSNLSGKAFIVKKDGTLISKSEELSKASSINDILPEKTYVDQLLSAMKSRNTGIITYTSTDTTRYIGYSRLSYNKWYVVCIISSSAVKANSDDVATDVIMLGVEIGFILLVLLVYLIYNIVSVKNKEKMNLERYFLASKYSDVIMTDYSVEKDTMYCNDNFEKKFGYSLPKENVKESLKEYIFSEDLDKYSEAVENLAKTKETTKFNLRIMDSNNNCIQCRVRLFPICGTKGKITKVLGFIHIKEDTWTE